MDNSAAPRVNDRDNNDDQTSLLGNAKGQASQDEQFHVLPRRQLLIVFPALALVHFTSFLDQTAVSTALPAIAHGLNIGPSISWVGASFLITSTSIQLINGPLSDIFGRKLCLITALIVMALGNIASGFSRTQGELFATRAFSGFGAGSLNALVQIAVSDYTTLEQRGYWFGIIGIATALGNGLGPLIGGALTQCTSWRWTFWFIGPMAGVAVIYLALALPRSLTTKGMRKKLKMVDWFGVVTSMLAVVLILIPLSQGGASMPWTSPTVIAMLTSGVALISVFLLIEWRYVRLPILPFRLFQYGRSTNILLGMNFTIGWIFHCNLFYIPLYFQNVRGWSPTMAGSLILPLVIAHGFTTGLNGPVIASLGRYTPIITTGAGIWVIGATAKTLYGNTTPVWMIIVFGIFEGISVGCSLQPILVGLLAGSDYSDRAVLTGLRNFLRDIGGGLGITVSGTILNNVLFNGLKGKVRPEVLSKLVSSAFNLKALDIPQEDKDLILAVYMRGLRAVFTSFAVLAGLYFCCSLLVEDYGLGGKEHLAESITAGSADSHEQ